MSRNHANGLEPERMPRLVTPGAWTFIQTCVEEERSRQTLSVGALLVTSLTPEGPELYRASFADASWWPEWIALPIHRSRQPKGPMIVIAPEWDAGPAAHTRLPEFLYQDGYKVSDDSAMDGGLPFYGRFTKKGRRTIILTDLHDYYRSPMVDLAEHFGPEPRVPEARLISDEVEDALSLIHI